METISPITAQESSPAEATEPELICAENPAPWPRYKPGTYDLRCISHEFVRVKMFGKHWKLRLMFRFMDGETKGRIAKFFHMGDGDNPKAGRKSEYFRAWVTANDGRLPRKGAQMSPSRFVGSVFRCTVRDVTRTIDPKIKHAPEGVYSVVDKILELCARG